MSAPRLAEVARRHRGREAPLPRTAARAGGVVAVAASSAAVVNKYKNAAILPAGGKMSPAASKAATAFFIKNSSASAQTEPGVVDKSIPRPVPPSDYVEVKSTTALHQQELFIDKGTNADLSKQLTDLENSKEFKDAHAKELYNVKNSTAAPVIDKAVESGNIPVPVPPEKGVSVIKKSPNFFSEPVYDANISTAAARTDNTGKN